MKNILLFILLSFSINAQSVLTTNGYKDISALQIGEKVIGKNGAENTVLGIRTFDSIWFAGQDSPDWKFYLINGTYKLFHNQNIVVAQGDYNVCHAFELKTSWKIYDENGNRITINSIEQVENNNVWYKLDISGDHTFTADGLLLHNASRFWVGAGASSNWNATGNTNWSATSGGSNNASVPGSSDNVTFDGAGGGNSANTNSATITILSLTYSSGFTNTTTLNAVVTIAGNFTDNTAHSWAGSSGITISAASTITSGGKTFPNGVTMTNTNTKTLSGNWTISGALTVSGSTILNRTTNETLSCAGLGGAQLITGTAKLILTGGTWNHSGTSNTLNMDIQGNVTVSGSVPFSGENTLTYVSGTVTTTSSTLNINNGSCTLNTNGITWNNITITSTGTYTINSLLSATGTLLCPAANVTFAGTAGFTVGTATFQNITSNTISLKNSVTYTVTTALNASSSRTGAILLFTSDDGTLKATLTLSQGATCNVLASFTRINASSGRSIVTFNGTITSCNNIVEKHDYGTVGF
jgi:hypothetical protein